MRKLLFLTILFTVLNVNNNFAQAQNYWGDGYVQPLNSKPETTPNNPSVKVTSLPDVPDVTSVNDNNTVNNSKSSPNKSPVLELGTSTEKIPVGSKLLIVLNNNLNSKKSHEGDPFSATVKEDLLIDNNVVLPVGTLIRGRVGKVKKPGLFSKSGSLFLNFDHIVTPLGKQVTLDVDLSSANKTNKRGALVANGGLGQAIKDSAKSGYNTTKVITKAGYDFGMAAGKVPVVATLPASAAVGTVAGTTVFATRSTIAIFKKGGNPVVNTGDSLEINFAEELDVPVN